MTSLFQRNLKLVERIDTVLADRVRKVEWPVEGMTVSSARSGVPTLRCAVPGGGAISFHSEYDPAREAVQYFDANPLGAHELHIVYGLGLGYIMHEAVARADPKAWVGCVEVDVRVLRAAMESVDLTPFLGRERVFLFAGTDWVELQARLAYLFSVVQPLSVGQIAHPGSVRLSGPTYATAQSQVSRSFGERQVGINTIFKLGPAAVKNAIRNLPVYFGSHGVIEFKDTCAGLPAVVVGAGPSLNPAIPLLRKIQGRALIVAVGRTLRRLTEEGIKPEFVATLDPQPFMVKCFQGYDIPDGVIHLVDGDSDSEAAKIFPGPAVTYDTESPLSLWLQSFQPSHGYLARGGSVVHSCYSLARFMGADPVMLIGVDMAFPEELDSHAKGMTRMTDAPRTPKDEEWVTIPKVGGGTVRSLRNYASFVTVFESLQVELGGTLVQTSEIGAAIQGAEHLSFAQAVEKYVRDDADVASRLRDVLKQPVAFDAERFGEESRALLEDVQKIFKAAGEGLEQVRKMGRFDLENRLDREKFAREFAKANESRNAILANLRGKKILGRLCARTQYSVREMTRDVAGMAPDAPERLKLAKEQLETFFTGYYEGAELFSGELKLVREEVLSKLGGSGRGGSPS